MVKSLFFLVSFLAIFCFFFPYRLFLPPLPSLGFFLFIPPYFPDIFPKLKVGDIPSLFLFNGPGGPCPRSNLPFFFFLLSRFFASFPLSLFIPFLPYFAPFFFTLKN